MAQETPHLRETLGVTPAAMASVLVTGHGLYEQGRMEDARKMFQGAALLDETNPYVHAMLGAIHQKQGEFEQAVDCYSRVVKLHPNDISTLTNRGECNLSLGRLMEAAEDLKTAMALDPDAKNPATNRARFLAAVTLEALKLAEEKGVQAVFDAKRRIDEQLAV